MQRRVAAAERFASAPLPTTDEEIWRYSRIGELDLSRYTPGRATTTGGAEPFDAEALGIAMTESPDVFADLNEAFADPLMVRIGDGEASFEPILVDHHIGHDGAL